MIHILKIKEEYYNQIINGNKLFEIRKNDRDYREGDILELHKLDNKGNVSRGCVFVRVKHIYSLGKLLKEVCNYKGYDLDTTVIMSIEIITLGRE